MKFQSDLSLDVEGAESPAQGKLQKFSTFKDSSELIELPSGSLSTAHSALPASLWSKPAFSSTHHSLLSLHHFPVSAHPSPWYMKSEEKGSPEGKERMGIDDIRLDLLCGLLVILGWHLLVLFPIQSKKHLG